MADNKDDREKSKRIGALGALWPFMLPYRGMLAAALAALRAAGADGRALADDLRAGRLPAGYSLQMP